MVFTSKKWESQKVSFGLWWWGQAEGAGFHKQRGKYFCPPATMTLHAHHLLVTSERLFPHAVVGQGREGSWTKTQLVRKKQEVSFHPDWSCTSTSANRKACEPSKTRQDHLSGGIKHHKVAKLNTNIPGFVLVYCDNWMPRKPEPNTSQAENTILWSIIPEEILLYSAEE